MLKEEDYRLSSDQKEFTGYIIRIGREDAVHA
jgi:hypothetical protein